MEHEHPFRPWWLLASPGFLAGLALLIVNDAVLKDQYPGVVTGKLSDFAGLWVFPMFWTVLAPRRRREIYLATAVLFGIWKSPLPQPLMDGWNGAAPYAIGRVTDATDLLALALLPLSFLYVRGLMASAAGRPFHRTTVSTVLVLTLFAFTATSRVPLEYGLAYGEGDPANLFQFDVPKDDLILALDAGHIDKLGRRYAPPAPPFFSLTIEVRLKATVCSETGYVDGNAEFRDIGGGKSVVVLTTMIAPCRHPENHRAELRDAYRTEVIDVLHQAVGDQ